MNDKIDMKFLGKLYDMLLRNDILVQDDEENEVHLKTKVDRVKKYFDKIKRVQDKAIGNDRYIEMIKELYYDRYVIKKEDIPESYLSFLEKKYFDDGYGRINLINPVKEEDILLREHHINEVINAQRDSLGNWLNYLLSDDSKYMPMWAKVWAFQGMLAIGNLNENKNGYKTRSRLTVNPFVSLDSEILMRCVGLLEQFFDKKEINDTELDKILRTGNFGKLYGMLLANKKQIKLNGDEGIWIKYTQQTEEEIWLLEDSGIEPEYIKLYNSLQGYNTGWCTAGSRETAKEQLCSGDFYVYYSKNEDGSYVIPRIAIRMEDEQIAEVRGIASGQNIESNLENVVDEKLKEFPDASAYKKKVSDMKLLTSMYYENSNGVELTIDQLKFLYEIGYKIDGFGYEIDPRIEELRNSRDMINDLNTIFKTLDDFGETIDLNYLSNANGLIFPKSTKSICLNKIRSCKGLTLPEEIDGKLDLSSLDDIEDLVFPSKLNGYLDLKSVKETTKLIIPEGAKSVYLSSLEKADVLIFPKSTESIFLNKIRSYKGLTLPEEIDGNLNLSSLDDIENLVFPSKLNGSLTLKSVSEITELIIPEGTKSVDLSSLEKAKKIVFSSTVESIDMKELKSVEELVFPEYMKSNLDLRSLIAAKGVTFPKKIDGDLLLSSLKSAENLVLPETVVGKLSLDGLTSAENLNFPRSYQGHISLDGISSAKGLKLPEFMAGGGLSLDGLLSSEGLVLPDGQYSINLNGLTDATGLIFPEKVGFLHIESLNSLENVVLPKVIHWLFIKDLSVLDGVDLSLFRFRKLSCASGSYSYEKVVELQERKKLNNDAVGKKRGFVSNTMIVSFVFIVILATFLITLMLIK